jgi:hypothetical protein
VEADEALDALELLELAELELELEEFIVLLE